MRFNERWLGALTVASVIGMGAHFVGGAQAKDEDKVELKGPAKNLEGSCPNLKFEIAGAKVKTSSRTDFEGDCNDVADGKRVEVEGKLRGDEVMASEVELD